MTKLNQKIVKEAIPGTFGIQSRVAEKLGVTRQAVHLYLKKHPKLFELLQQEEEIAIDEAERTIYSLSSLKTDDHRKLGVKLKASEKILNSKGAKRGWENTSRQKLEHSGEGLKIIIEKADNGNGSSKVETESKTRDGVQDPSG